MLEEGYAIPKAYRKKIKKITPLKKLVQKKHKTYKKKKKISIFDKWHSL